MTEMTLAEAIAEVTQPANNTPGWLGRWDEARRTILNAVASGDLITKAEIERGLADPVVVNYNMLRGTIAKPSLAQIVHVYAGDLIPKADKDAAYLERNKLVALLAAIFPSGIKRTAIPGWSDDWHGCVYIDFPWGQASWHYHDSHADLFAHLPPYEGEWNGHTTAAKYDALVTVAKSRLDLIPRTDAERAVALAYQRAASRLDCGCMAGCRDETECPKDDVAAILALAPADALAEVQALIQERDELKAWRRHWEGEIDVILAGRRDEYARAEAAEAELARLRALMRRVVEDPVWRTNDNTLWPDLCAALTPQKDATP